MTPKERVVGFYVGGLERRDFDSLAEARAFFDAHPEYGVLGRWLEAPPREGPYGVMIRSRHGDVLIDRRARVEARER